MKAAAVFAIILLICGAQARGTDVGEAENKNIIQTQLKNLIDYINTKLKTSIKGTEDELEKLNKETEKARQHFLMEMNEYVMYFENLSDGSNSIHERAKKLNVSTLECDSKWAPLKKLFEESTNGIISCYSKQSRLIKSKYNDLIMQFAITKNTIEDNAIQARLCIDQATVFTSLSAAACLAKAEILSDLVYAVGPGKIELRSHASDIEEFKKQLQTCRAGMVDDMRAKSHYMDIQVQECIFDKISKET
uniref:Uncharacterized protein n=1 Tax=Trichogramma kaykai TaxID=54128 RepID=A0ABD2XR71_9HYME